MAFAVVDSAGIEKCDMGSETDNVTAFIPAGITLEGNTASSILDCRTDPDFGDCIIWAIITAGSETACNPAVLPLWSAGVSSVFWEMILANGDEDTGTCLMGGTITIPYAGTTIIII
tara:strand:+ start:1874 stop:2224 length:351 start_codon:yes stop_codon:yes gene_type:complete